MRSSVLLLIFMFLLSSASAQRANNKNVLAQDYLYKKELSFGLRAQSNGFSLYGEYGWIKDIHKTRILQVEYNYFINYQQKRTKSQIQNGRAFNFGVQNRFHAIRVAAGIKRTIADKAMRNGVRLSYTALGGFSLGLVKPYYLMLIQPSDGALEIKEERYSESNASRFLSLDSIVQAAPIRYGLGQMEVVPGIHGKFSLDFEFGNRDKTIKALEAGLMLDLYYKRIPVMINKSNRFYQIGLYLAFHFGKRW